MIMNGNKIKFHAFVLLPILFLFLISFASAKTGIIPKLIAQNPNNVTYYVNYSTGSSGGGGNTTEEMQDAVGSGFTGNLSYNDLSNLFDLNGANVLSWLSGLFLSKSGDTATGNYTFDINTFFIDSINNRVGINTTSPSQSLEVAGSMKVATILGREGATLSINGASGQNVLIGGLGGGTVYISPTLNLQDGTQGLSRPGLNDLGIRAGGAVKITVKSDGNVGIGTTSPQNKLNVLGQVNATQFVVNASSGFTGTCTISGLINITVVGGIITNCV